MNASMRQRRGNNHRRAGVLVVFALASAMFSGCSTLTNVGFYFNLWRADRAGKRFYKNYEHIERAVPYSDESDVRLDAYSPEEGTGHPILIFIHGGGWHQYDRLLFAPVAMRLVPKDLVVVIPDYTLHPDAGYEQMAREVADSVAWVRSNAARLGGDPDAIVLSGHSAGGHLSALVAYDARWLPEEGLSPGDLAGWIGLSGVYDIDAQFAFEREKGGDAPIMTEVMGGHEGFAAASPITYVSAEAPTRTAGTGDGTTPVPETPQSAAQSVAQSVAQSAEARPPATIIHGERDTSVPVSMSRTFAEALAEAGTPVDLKVYPDADHTSFLFSGLTDENAPVLRDIERAVHAAATRSRN